MDDTHAKQWSRLWVGAMGILQRSQVVMKVSTLKGPMLTALSPTIMVAEDGRDVERGLGLGLGLWGGDVEEGCCCCCCANRWASGRRACVQHRPWFTQSLQKPQSPSLQTSHRQ